MSLSLNFRRRLSLLTLCGWAAVGGYGKADAPVTMDKVTVSATGLDISSDPAIDYVLPKPRLIFEYLGHDVPPAAILDARSTEDLKHWRPTYGSLDEFVAGVRHKDWTLVRSRDLPNFYVAVFATPHGNVAGLYYAKTDRGYRQEQAGQLQLYVSNEQYQPLVSEDQVFSVEQRFGYAVRSFGGGPSVLAPDDTKYFGGSSAGGMTNLVEVSARRGWVTVHQGQMFVIPAKVSRFLFVFASKVGAEDRLVLSFANRKG